MNIKYIVKIASGVISLFIMAVGVNETDISSWGKLLELIIYMLKTPYIVVPFLYSVYLMVFDNKQNDVLATKLKTGQVKLTNFLNK